jgi:hypothetical protein
MPITYEWVDEMQTLVLVTLKGEVAVEDFYAGDLRLCAMLDSVDHPVDMISDYTNRNYFAPGYGERVQKMDALFRPNLRFVIFVGSKLLWELFDLYNANFEPVAFEYDYAETVAEGRKRIAEMRLNQRLIGERPRSPEWN